MQTTTTNLKALDEMTTHELCQLKDATDARIREIGRKIALTPRDTTAYDAMIEGRAALQGFWAAVEEELIGRGA